MRAILTLAGPVAVAVVLSASATGAALTLAGLRSPVTGPLTLVFVLFTPALCVALLLPRLEPTARMIVSVTASVALAGSIAEVMLVTGGWSPKGGIVATAIACAALAAAALTLRLRARPRRAGASTPAGLSSVE